MYKPNYQQFCSFISLAQVSPGGTDIVINSGNLPNGIPLPDVTKINIAVDSPAKLSDLYLHACYTPGNYLF